MNAYDVMVVEDDPALSEALCDTLELQGYRVISARNGSAALQKLANCAVKLVISDVQMPVLDGLGLLQNLRHQYPNLPVILMTAFGNVPKAVAAIQAGAVDYLIKPFEAATLVDKVASHLDSWGSNAHIPSLGSPLVIQDPCMRQLYGLLTKIAKTDVAVLLQGESGTGKEVVAKYIHQHSKHQQGPFVAVNCAAIPENMLEAMLFGYEKGAFTGAVQAMPGKFEQAQGGTLLLDEIAEMDLALQAKILRVLQEKEVERLGSQKKIHLAVRILAATNQKLKQRLEQGLFREDLYYRLNVFPITIPPLRQRLGDIVPLANQLLQRHCPVGQRLPQMEPAAAAKIQGYAWPGNVRELENVMQRALILCADHKITETDLIFEEFAFMEQPETWQAVRQEPVINNDGQAAVLTDGVRSAEEAIILQTLQMAKGSRKTAAERLGISARTLRYKMARMKDAGVIIPC